MKACTVSPSLSEPVRSRATLMASSMLGMTVIFALGSRDDHRSANVRCTVSFWIASGSYW